MTKWTNHIVALTMKRRMKTLSWRKDLKLNAARCFSGTHATVRVTEEAVVTSGSCVECVLTWAMSKWRKTVGLSMKSRIKSLSWRKDLKLNDVEVKTLSWRKDLKLNAARCFSGTRATVRFSKETVVTSGSRVKRVLTRAISKLTKHIVTFNEEEDEDTLVEEVPQLNAARCFSGTHATVRFTRETFVTSGSHVKRVLPWAMSKWRKTVGLSMKRRMKTLSWRKDLKLNDVEQDEDTLVEERPQIERGTMFHRDTRHRVIHQRNIRDKWFPREACFVLGDVKVENVIVAFREEEEEDTFVEEGPQIERGTVFLRGTCHCDSHQRNSRDKRLPREACFDQGVVKVGKDIVSFNDEIDEDALVEEGPQIERGLVFHRDACHREIYQRNIRDKRLLHEVCFDLGDVKVGETHCDLQSRGG